MVILSLSVSLRASSALSGESVADPAQFRDRQSPAYQKALFNGGHAHLPGCVCECVCVRVCKTAAFIRKRKEPKGYFIALIHNVTH